MRSEVVFPQHCMFLVGSGLYCFVTSHCGDLLGKGPPPDFTGLTGWSVTRFLSAPFPPLAAPCPSMGETTFPRLLYL